MATETANAPAEVVESQSTQVVHPEEMNEKQRDRWLLTGEHPEIQAKEAAPPSAAKENAAPQAAHEEPRQKKTAADRVQELLKERHELRQELEKLKAPKADPQPAAAKTETPAEIKEPTAPERPKRPDIVQFKTTAEYELAMDKYDQEMEDFSAKKAAFDTAKVQADTRKRQIEEFNKGIENKWKGMVTAAKEKHDDFDKVALSQELANQIVMGSPIDEWVLQSDVGAEMLYFLGQNRDELKRINSLPRPQQHKELAKLEEKLSAPVKEEKPAEEPREPKRKVTAAGEPPREVGGKASAVEDPIKAAVARRDFSTFANEANKRDIQRKTRG